MKGLVAVVMALAVSASARESQAPVRGGFTGAPVVTPVLSLQLPVTPAGNAYALSELLRKAAGAALGYGQNAGVMIPGAMNFAPGRDIPTPPPLPGSAMKAAEQGQGLAVLPQQGLAPAKSPTEFSATPLKSPGIIPLIFQATMGIQAASQKTHGIAAKSEILQAPFAAAAGLATSGTGRVGGEAAKKLGDGIWDVMMEQQTVRDGQATGDLRDAMGSQGSSTGEAFHETAAARADLEALDYSSLAAGGPSAAARAATGVWGEFSGQIAGETPAGVTAQEYLLETVDAAETARRYAREHLTQAAGDNAAGAYKPGPIEKVWLRTWDAVVRVFSSGEATALKPGWSAVGGQGRDWLSRSTSYGKPLGTVEPVTGGATSVGGGGSQRLVTVLASRRASDNGPVLLGPAEFSAPAAETLPDALLGLSLLPLLALALAYMREFRR